MKWIKLNGRFLKPENIEQIREAYYNGNKIPDPVYKKKIDLFYEYNKMWMKEAYRVLKPGAFSIIMCSARQDLQMSVVQALSEAGFNVNFTPIYWTYCDGFPKALNISKAIDKRAGKERKIIEKKRVQRNTKTWESHNSGMLAKGEQNFDVTEPATKEAKEFDGAYGGFQPKPAVEVCLVAMKPLSENTYVDQALANGKGVSWIDGCRIPTNELEKNWSGNSASGSGRYNWNVTNKKKEYQGSSHSQGRFPANLLVSNNILDDGEVTKSDVRKSEDKDIKQNTWALDRTGTTPRGVADSGSKSRFFDLDRWAVENKFPQEDLFGNREKSMIDTLPFMFVSKPTRSERDKGLYHLSERKPVKNDHVTVKPVKLMGYLATMFTSKGDVVCDPFMGSGSTGIACKIAERNFIGMEMDEHSFNIAKERIENW